MKNKALTAVAVVAVGVGCFFLIQAGGGALMTHWLAPEPSPPGAEENARGLEHLNAAQALTPDERQAPLERARRAFEAALEADRTVGVYHCNLAFALLAEGEAAGGERQDTLWREAEPILETGVGLDGGLDQCWANLGLSRLYRAKQIPFYEPNPFVEPSVEALRKALELNPLDKTAWDWLAAARLIQAQAAKTSDERERFGDLALEASRMVMKLDPGSKESLLGGAVVMGQIGAFLRGEKQRAVCEEAVSMYRSGGLTFGDSLSHVWSGYASALFCLRSHAQDDEKRDRLTEEVRSAAENAIVLGETNAEAWHTLAMLDADAYFAASDATQRAAFCQSATRSAKTARDLTPQDPYSWFLYASLLPCQERTTQPQKLDALWNDIDGSFRKAVTMMPDRTNIWEFWKGVLQKRFEDHPGAKTKRFEPLINEINGAIKTLNAGP